MDLTHQNMEPALNFMMLMRFSNISSPILVIRMILKDLEVFLVSLAIEMAKKHLALAEWVALGMMISSMDLEAVDLGPVALVHFHHHHLEVECLA